MVWRRIGPKELKLTYDESAHRLENILVPLEIAGVTNAGKKARDLLGHVDLNNRGHHYPSQLSGGEQQMLAISRALMQKPRLLLLDEPSLGLSPRLVKDIFDIVRRLNEEHRMTILIVEQNANMALQVAHYGYVLEVGRIVMEDVSASLRGNKDIKEFYLGIQEEGVRGTRRWKRKKVWR